MRDWSGITVGFALTGSHCTYAEVLPQMARFIEHGAEVVPIISHTLQTTDTRFGAGSVWIERISQLTKQNVISTIVDAEPLGPSKRLDVMVIAPCTGASMSKLANAITDSPVLMAAKSQMRNLRPLVIAMSTNDGLGLNAVNWSKLITAKNIYFVPFGQDAPELKPNSLIARMDLIMETCDAALEGKQVQPVLIDRR